MPFGHLYLPFGHINPIDVAFLTDQPGQDKAVPPRPAAHIQDPQAIYTWRYRGATAIVFHPDFIGDEGERFSDVAGKVTGGTAGAGLEVLCPFYLHAVISLHRFFHIRLLACFCQSAMAAASPLSGAGVAVFTEADLGSKAVQVHFPELRLLIALYSHPQGQVEIAVIDIPLVVHGEQAPAHQSIQGPGIVALLQEFQISLVTTLS